MQYCRKGLLGFSAFLITATFMLNVARWIVPSLRDLCEKNIDTTSLIALSSFTLIGISAMLGSCISEKLRDPSKEPLLPKTGESASSQKTGFTTVYLSNETSSSVPHFSSPSKKESLLSSKAVKPSASENNNFTTIYLSNERSLSIPL